MKLFAEPIFRRAALPSLAPAPVPVAIEATPKPATGIDRLEDRMALLRETFDLLEVDVMRLIGEVMRGGEAADDDISHLGQATCRISAGAAELAASAENAAQHVRRIADSSIELEASGEEINRRLRDVTALAMDGRRATEAAHDSVEGLKISCGEIGSIVGLISSIARRIDLVALNSMIEAARAGSSGRAFAVVASEVKSLASATQRATDDIAKRIEQLQSNSTRLIACVERIGNLIESLSPVILAISDEVDTQTRMTAALSHSIDQAAAFAHDVGSNANATAHVCTSTAATALSAGKSIRRVLLDADKLRSRFVIFLRQTEMGNRRRHERLPCDLTVTFIDGDIKIGARAIDISEGGMLAQTEQALAAGKELVAEVGGLGRCGLRIVGRSTIGLHVQWRAPPPEFVAALEGMLTEIRADHADLESAVIENAASIGGAMEDAIASGRLTMDALFDADYELIQGTSPPQYRTQALAVLEEILPPIQNRVLNSNPKIVFCVALDRNTWLPVHNPEYAQKQRPDDYEWNCHYARNMRFFDDRAGLAASRNIRPSLIQIYNRDLGGGNFVLMKEVNAPIRVFGRHWGGLRVAYKREA